MRDGEGPPSDGAEHATVAGHPDQERVRRRRLLAVAAQLTQLYVQHAVVRGQGARRHDDHEPEAGAAEQGGCDGVPSQPRRWVPEACNFMTAVVGCSLTGLDHRERPGVLAKEVHGDLLCSTPHGQMVLWQWHDEIFA